MISDKKLGLGFRVPKQFHFLICPHISIKAYVRFCVSVISLSVIRLPIFHHCQKQIASSVYPYDCLSVYMSIDILEKSAKIMVYGHR